MMKHFTRGGRLRKVLRTVGISLGMTILTLAALEIFLRVADLRELREGPDGIVGSAGGIERQRSSAKCSIVLPAGV